METPVLLASIPHQSGLPSERLGLALPPLPRAYDTTPGENGHLAPSSGFSHGARVLWGVTSRRSRAVSGRSSTWAGRIRGPASRRRNHGYSTTTKGRSPLADHDDVGLDRHMENASPFERHRLQVMPTSSSGRRAGRFAAVFVAGVAAMQLVVASGQRGGETVFDNWWITAPAVAAAVGAVGALIFGVTAIA